jgi:hypothetical protein
MTQAQLLAGADVVHSAPHFSDALPFSIQKGWTCMNDVNRLRGGSGDTIGSAASGDTALNYCEAKKGFARPQLSAEPLKSTTWSC